MLNWRWKKNCNKKNGVFKHFPFICQKYIEKQNKLINRPSHDTHLDNTAFLSSLKNSTASQIALKNYNAMLKTNRINREILEFMLLLMDECTNLINFDKPYDNTMTHILSAQDDAYILRDGVYDFTSIWPGN